MSLPPLPLSHVTWAPRPCDAPSDVDAVTSGVRELKAAQLRVVCNGLSALPQDVQIALGRASRTGLTIKVEREATIPLSQTELDAYQRAGVHCISVAAETTHAELERFVHAVRRVGYQTEVRTALPTSSESSLSVVANNLCALGFDRWTVIVEPKRVLLPRGALEDSLHELAQVAAHTRMQTSVSGAPFLARICAETGTTIPHLDDERRTLFINDRADVLPACDVPIVLGNLRMHSLSNVYRLHPVLRALRDPSAIEGKCGICAYKLACGGSRRRAYAQCGNIFASDPACSFGFTATSPQYLREHE